MCRNPDVKASVFNKNRINLPHSLQLPYSYPVCPRISFIAMEALRYGVAQVQS